MLILFLTISLVYVHYAQSIMTAVAKIHLDSKDGLTGFFIFAQMNENSPVIIKGNIWNMPPNTVHGLHVHEHPLSNDVLNCTAAGSHFNPYGTSHGSITEDINHRHVGDLGNVTSNSNGHIHIDIKDSIIQLCNATQSITNRTIVLHAMRDDGGKGGFSDSNTTGNAGARLACGTIVLQKAWFKQ
ncbi:unnamed protein product [Adineta ricciae]|uniref:Superoxide dismutase [Cu-Zn] n=1 Tax=Adineta ricciae TaxID=249248 RepID=A0A814MKQ6_ADIRI|nr:unnamed protein product [Adineta ricciae]CAF1080005.1 unnamed protein product [Adineta ricciae]